MRSLAYRSERGQALVIFALVLPLLFAMSGVVVGLGNWFVHGKHLQTKADAGAFAGGGSWAFPCAPEIDARIEAQARLYAGSNNPQVGGVPDTSIHTVLNGSDWYDDDSNPTPNEFDSPAGSVCSANILDVKVTEDNSFPLASLIPIFPDVKRKARIEIQEGENFFGLLPIAVRAPEPISAAAIFYDESPNANPQKDVLGVKYLVRGSSPSTILPATLQGWTTYNTDDVLNTEAQFTPSERTGVVIAISFRGACDTNIPGTPPPPGQPDTRKIKVAPPGTVCFEDEGYDNQSVDDICNQTDQNYDGQIVNCYYATGAWPSESVNAGLHFIRGYGSADPGNNPPLLRTAYLASAGGSSGCSYFNTLPNAACEAVLNATIALGEADPDGAGPRGVEQRLASNAEVRYRIVNDTGNYGGTPAVCTSFATTNCDLGGSGSGNNTTWSTGNILPKFNANTRRNSIVMRIRLSDTRVGTTQCPPAGTFNATCEWFFTAAGTVTSAPNDATALAAPVQRSFRGNSITASSIKWLQLTTREGCGATSVQDGAAGGVSQASDSCFLMDVGLKGAAALSANEDAILFDDGTGSSQVGTVDCDPNIPQGQEMIEGIKQGCNVWYGPHPFDWNPLCPTQNNLFSGYPGGNPGPPWDDGRWPPLRCLKTRPTSTANQMERGFKGRFFDNENQNSCPGGAAGGPGFIKGRNYWDKDTANGYTGNPLLGYQEPGQTTYFNEGDKRLVTIFLVPTEAFTASGQKTFPITGFIEVYITGFGRVRGNGTLQIDDPCPGNTPPPDLDLSGASANGYLAWGHILKHAVEGPNATGNGELCDPNASLNPCVPVLVE